MSSPATSNPEFTLAEEIRRLRKRVQRLQKELDRARGRKREKGHDAEAALRESEARERARAAELQALMDAVPAVINISRNREGTQIVSNALGYQLLRMPPGGNISKSAPDGERPQHFQAFRDGHAIPAEDLPVQYAGRTGEEVRDCEFDLVFDDGETRHWIGNAVPLRDAAGQPCGAVAVFMDVTERRRTEERRRQSQKLESIGLLAGGIAHDFNNILVGVIGNASLAQEMLPEGHPCVGPITEVVAAGERAAHLTRQMLAYAGKAQFLIEALDLSKAVAEMSGLMKRTVPAHVAMRYELEPRLPAIEADRGQMEQVLVNLVTNAAEAIGDRAGTITVRTGVRRVSQPEDAAIGEVQPGHYVYLEVADTGCGMSEKTRARIFEPFFSTKFTGRGLGLAAAGGVVLSHKGAVQVASIPGAGSRITVLLPAPGMAKEASAGTILVVDDERTVREIARQCLERSGFKVLVAESGREAIDIAKRDLAGLSMVLLDLSMPGMNGHQTAAELLALRSDLPVVISSGYSESETMRHFDGQEVAGFVQKPYTSTRLVEAVKGILKQLGGGGREGCSLRED